MVVWLIGRHPSEQAEPVEQALDGLEAWMARRHATITAVLLLLIGAKMVRDALSGFSS